MGKLGMKGKGRWYDTKLKETREDGTSLFLGIVLED